MQCMGRTKKFSRCRKAAKLLFCKQHRYQPLVLLLSILTIIGLFGGIFQDIVRPIFIAWRGINPENSSEKADQLAVVDVGFLEKVEDRFPVLDVKLRNTGEVAVLKLARFHIKAIWPYRWVNCPTALPASWRYDVMLPISGEPPIVEIAISQEVRMGEADRFQFSLGNDASVVDESLSYVFWVGVELIYNEDGRSVSLPDLAFVSGPAQSLWAWTQCRHPVDIYSGNKRVYNGLKDFSGVMDKDLPNILKKYDGSRVTKFEDWIGKAGEDREELYYYIWSLAMIAESEPSVAEVLGRLKEDEREVVRELATEALAALANPETLARPEAAGRAPVADN